MVEPDDTAKEEAASWFSRLQTRSVTTGELADFARWRRDPANAAAYEAVDRFWSRSAALENDPDIRDAVRKARGGARTSGGRRFGLGAVKLGVLTLGVATCCLAGFHFLSADPTYRTARGERSAINLEDGTRIRLDADSVVTTRFETRRRNVVLERGQVFLSVHHDPTRPLVVDAGDGLTVEAVGTRFDVRRLADRVRVALLDGAVVVRRRGSTLTTMRPGEAIEVLDGGGVHKLPWSAAGAAWLDGRLSFKGTPLKTAVAEINRYSRKPIVIGAGADREQPLSGEFSVEDPSGFVTGVNALLGDGTLQPADDR